MKRARSCRRRLTMLAILAGGVSWAVSPVSRAQNPVVDGAREPADPGMVFIPAGEFPMGKEGHSDFSPVHRVCLDPFYLDRHEVTNAQYQAFCESTGRRLPEFWGIDEFRSGPDYPTHPVVGVSWYDARAYARWRRCRLPTEAEWEYAARGSLEDMNYSHGDEFDSGLYAETGVTGNAGPSPVGMFPPNGFGLHDMTGNVGEWVSDWYDPDYYRTSPRRIPTGPGHGRFRVIRGGGWHTGPFCSGVFYRNALPANWVDINVGFRCAKYKGESGALLLERLIEETGLAGVSAAYHEMRLAPPGEIYFDERELNDAGYRLMAGDRAEAAIEIFKVNVEAFPRSYNAYDSLGETYRVHGDRERALANYRRSLELNPACETARMALEEMEAE